MLPECGRHAPFSPAMRLRMNQLAAPRQASAGYPGWARRFSIPRLAEYRPTLLTAAAILHYMTFRIVNNRLRITQ